MTISVERRVFPRFKIPGAKIIFHQEEELTGDKAISVEGLVDDISLKGIRFTSQSKLQSGAKIKLELIIPEKESISFLGNMIWISSYPKNEKTFGFIEFTPFGEGENFNPLVVQENLEKILAEYK